MKKSVGQESFRTIANAEVLSPALCGIKEGSSFYVHAFYIVNQSSEDIGVSINYGDFIVLRPGEMYSLSGITEVASCRVNRNAVIRWGGVV